MVNNQLPKRALSFYGDDFTGSTDVMEALSLSGVKAALFLEPPDSGQLREYPDVQAVGVAGQSRSMSPDEMDQHLPEVFEGLVEVGAPLTHYKVCSTFDSSPEIGSIGRATEIGAELHGSDTVPMLVGAPRLERYCAFGNLFARSGPDSPIYRLDRHPTMSQHPVTPMTESNLVDHLSEQTDRSIELFNLLQLNGSQARIDEAYEDLLQTNPDIVMFDVLYPGQMADVGRQIWRGASGDAPGFTVGSSGVEYALTAHWRDRGLIPEPPDPPGLEPVEQLVVASGSCSPVTGEQIGHALERGFEQVRVETPGWVDPERTENVRSRVVEETLEHLHGGSSVVVHTCRGPEDERIERTQEVSDRLTEEAPEPVRPGRRIATQLGWTLKTVLEESGLDRALVTGGDTSGYVAKELDVKALELEAPMAPGAPMCRARATPDAVDHMELCFKGGQCGTVQFFTKVLHGQF